MKKVKVSELPVCTTLKGLYTLGTDVNNKSVKVSLEFVEEKAAAAQAAADKATQEANKATAAKQAADTATAAANTATNNAKTATNAANTATAQANTARDNANTAANNANTAAINATSTAQAAAQAATKTASDAAAAAKKTAEDAAKTATDAAADARAAEAAAQQARDEADAAAADAVSATEMLIHKLGTLIPTAMSVKPVPRITYGNKQPIYIEAVLSPEQVAKNIIYISDNRAVSVTQDGHIEVLGIGRSTLQIIPTLNTALAKTIQVEVGLPTLRLVNTRSRLRFTASGAVRLN